MRPTYCPPPYGVIVADPPWKFDDPLTMSDVKRGAGSNYPVLDLGEIKRLQVAELCAITAVLALWVPSAMLQDGLDVMRCWGFEYKQLFTWVKTAGGPSGIAMGMGRYFRNATEHALVGTRGKPRPLMRGERNVVLHPALPHSRKPEALQDSLDRMYANRTKLEIFARRARPGWTCVGNECPGTMGEDVRDSIAELLRRA